MKRIGLLLLICVVLATALTVASAWLCTSRGPSAAMPAQTLTADQIIERFSPRHLPDGLPTGFTMHWREGGVEVGIIGFDVPAWAGIRAGWPIRCMMAEATSTQGATAITWDAHNAIEIKSSRVFVPGTVLPTRIIPVPFMLNTLVNTTFLLAVYVILPWNRYHRASRRREHGRCPECSFDLRAQFEDAREIEIRCPECSQTTPRHRFEPSFALFQWWMLALLVPVVSLTIRVFIERQTWSDLVPHWRLETAVWSLATRVAAIALIASIILAIALKKRPAVRPSNVQLAALVIVSLGLSILFFAPLIVWTDLLVEWMATV